MAYKIRTVDDSTTIRKIVRRALDNFNCEILEAQNGMEGLATANKERPDIKRIGHAAFSATAER